MGIKMCGTVSTIWGSPITGATKLEDAVEFTKRWFSIGAFDIEHADHDPFRRIAEPAEDHQHQPDRDQDRQNGDQPGREARADQGFERVPQPAAMPAGCSLRTVHWASQSRLNRAAVLSHVP